MTIRHLTMRGLGTVARISAFLALLVAHVSGIESSAGSDVGASYEHPSVCIVGAGIGGASAAFSLRNGQMGDHVHVEVFEAADRVGGRITNADLFSGSDVEGGASIIAADNRCMATAVSDLGLTRRQTQTYEKRTMGMWDGTQFRWSTTGTGWYDALLMLRRYGFDIIRMKRYVSKLLRTFDNLYGGMQDGFHSMESFLERATGLYELTQQSFENTFGYSVGSLLMDELVSAITRVNYNQEAYAMNGLAGAVSIAGSGGGLWSVQGGNQQVVEGLLKSSNASVHLQTRVRSIVTNETRYTIHAESEDGSEVQQTCDAIIIATPLESARIDISDIVDDSKWNINRKFTRTVATFVKGSLRPTYFGLGEQETLPGLIVTTAKADTPFSSIGHVTSADDASPVYKIFSKLPLSDETLQQLFQEPVVLQQLDWQAYPQFKPPEIFPDFQLAGSDHALYYTSTIESAASAMEMSCLAGQNVAALAAAGLEKRAHDGYWSDVTSSSSVSEHGLEVEPKTEL